MASNMKIKKKSSEKTFDIINGAFLLILVILVAYPLYYVLIASISDPYEVYAGKTFLLPSKITFEGYKRVFKENSIAGGYLNSIYYTVLGTVVSVALVLTTGYCMSKKELYEAASIDGSGNIRTFVKIALPLAKPIIAVMVIFTMVAYWNDWFTALIYMQEKSRYPLQLVLRQILIQSQAMASMMGNMDGGYAEANKLTELIKFASIVVGSVPMLIAYPFVQKYFEKGFMAGAVKG